MSSQKEISREPVTTELGDHPGEAPSLAELQAAFQAAILDGKTDILSTLKPGAHADRDTLLGVYRTAYAARLVEVLRSEYPQLAAYLGDDRFEAEARAYIAACPSRHRSARYVGTAWPDFLPTRAIAMDHPVVAELAILERALSDTFDAAGSSVATMADLAAVPPDQWERLVMRPCSATRRLDLHTNALDIWSALKNETPPPGVTAHERALPIFIWRDDGLPMVRLLCAEEAMLWDEMARGVPFGRLCELAALFDAPDAAVIRVAGVIRGWLDGGLLAGMTSQAVS